MNGDLHGNASRIQSLLKRIKKSKKIPARNKELMLKFTGQCRAEGLKTATVLKYLYPLRFISRCLNKPFDEATKENIIKVLDKTESRNDWSNWTKRGVRITLKKFYKWLRGTDVYPEEVRWINTSLKNNKHKLPTDMLTEEEVKRMVNVATNPRDKALISVLYESGARIGEILSLRIKDLVFDEFGCKLSVVGKTGSRRIRVIAAAPALSSWLENHPFKKNLNAPLWTTRFNRFSENGIEPLGYQSIRKLLSTLTKRAGIKKRVYPHLFRHSRATHLANRLTEAQIKEIFGWGQDSKMTSIYVHLSGRDVDNALLELYGLRRLEKEGEKFKVKICPRCQEMNEPSANSCKKCTFILDWETAMRMEEKKQRDLHALAKTVESMVLERLRINKIENPVSHRIDPETTVELSTSGTSVVIDNDAVWVPTRKVNEQ